MSSDNRTVALLAQLDGVVAGLALAYIAIKTWSNFKCNSSALDKIRRAKTVPISDLRSLISSCANESETEPSDEKLVVVRGLVEATPGSSRPNVLLCHNSGDRGVALQETHNYILLNEWKRLSFHVRAVLLGKPWRCVKSSSLRTVPFILVGSAREPLSDYVIVNLDGSTHPLPLSTVYHQSPYHTTPFLRAIFGYEYPVGLIEEKILPLGKEISAVGICSSQDGNPQIKACEELPYFLSDMTKDQMVENLSYKANILFWSVIILVPLSVGILGYALTRNWVHWKEWRQKRQAQQSRNDADDVDDCTRGIPDGELCIICLARKRRFAFVPCGHLVCCHRCVTSAKTKCPMCRREIRTSVRVDSFV